MDILNFRINIVCHYFTNLQSCDQKYNLNVINIYEEKYHQFLDMIRGDGNMSETTLGMNGIRDEMTGILTAYGNISFYFIFFIKESKRRRNGCLHIYQHYYYYK